MPTTIFEIGGGATPIGGVESQFAPSPEHGAAQTVIFTRVDPGSVITQEDMDRAIARIRFIQGWAMAQPTNVRVAYLWAAKTVSDMVVERFKLHENSRRVRAAFDNLPKPPVEE